MDRNHLEFYINILVKEYKVLIENDGLYRVYYNYIIRDIQIECICSYLSKRYNSFVARIFRLLSSGDKLEDSVIAKMTLIPTKECNSVFLYFIFIYLFII